MPDAEGHPNVEEFDFQAVLKALSDPLRYHVIATLVRQPQDTERTCTSFGLPVGKSTRTHHFRILREAGLVRQVDRGNSRSARLRREDIEQRFPGLLRLVAENEPLPGNEALPGSGPLPGAEPLPANGTLPGAAGLPAA
ncbi:MULTISPECIES: ArsR/SmtB family transcription factor [Streptomyces]|uniref:Helix-turn-helix transcriptional regulator n=1 Tax=Streptomyces evansiae TaxID=3075535 RepID=A0ABU2QX60_9ACTN|nr:MULTISPECIES: helix-turn-helix transcriptional regulator [unclassified Streptomyces]EFL02057.1 ArsR family transcriptional regulator [Streptomyces sp. SPB78]MDT0407610.1 helix-turn-helix transcriptional regulator [Streptomyces sp. DSM 41979]MDT0421373.1 helix-turn-helix transcriptional regulator [Streptomyces sp. DSM 41859]MYQ61110.1 helix-turn-helix domain-containing protein [Streptomyces sp. SID4926]MYR28869.1 helix-turn-helix domain-containing protein [Streptomyces sp. SID4945]